ncbi:MAG: hypothetical protein Q9218_002414 [Villophora microphyllina]
MALPLRRIDVIEIEDESDDGQNIGFDNFMTNEEIEATLHHPSGVMPGIPSPGFDADLPVENGHPQPPIMTSDSCLTEVLEVFPDISRDHVKSLYDTHVSAGIQAFGGSLSEHLISQILDGGKYPKERDRQNELKRKRSSAQTSDDERAAKWQTLERPQVDSIYRSHVRDLLKEDFPTIPIRFIQEKLKELGHLYATYLALDQADEAYDTSVPRPYSRLTYPRNSRPNMPPKPDTIGPTGYAYEELKRELEAARLQRRKLQTQRQIRKDAAAAEAAEEKELRDSNQVMECGCCFDDVPINKITFCNADDPHPFCFSCAGQNAAAQVGMTKHTLSCMSGSDCKATFSHFEKRRFLDDKTMEKLDRLQQQTDLREANLANLESCPFCDFAAICPPIEADKEFRCGNAECEKISCRKCRLITHIPLTCEESKKENGISERHLIEEARTMALLRKCHKCKASVIKEYGCNRLHCTCGAYICDSCGKDITNDNYSHFSEGPLTGMRGKCRTYDNDDARNKENMDAAEKEAVKKIREENPNISEEDLKIKMDESTKSPRRRALDRFGPMQNLPNMHAIHQDVYRDYMGLGVPMPQWLAAGPMPPMPAMPYAPAFPVPIAPPRARPAPYRPRANGDNAAIDGDAMLNGMLNGLPSAERVAPPQPREPHARPNHHRQRRAHAHRGTGEPIDYFDEDEDDDDEDLFMDPPPAPLGRRMDPIAGPTDGGARGENPFMRDDLFVRPYHPLPDRLEGRPRHDRRDRRNMEREMADLSAELAQRRLERQRRRDAVGEMGGMCEDFDRPPRRQRGREPSE